MVGYGVLALTVSSPQLLPEEPISIAEAKVLARIEHDEENDLIQAFITSARIAAEYETGYQLAVKQWDLTLDGFSGCDIGLPEPLQSVDSVRYRDSGGVFSTGTEGTDYDVDLARSLIHAPYNGSWPSFTPWPSGSVTITCRAGYPASHPFWSNQGVPIMLGMRFLITHWNTNRDLFAAKGATELPYRAKYLFGMFGKMRVR